VYNDQVEDLLKEGHLVRVNQDTGTMRMSGGTTTTTTTTTADAAGGGAAGGP
jgi:hypothetical protein